MLLTGVQAIAAWQRTNARSPASIQARRNQRNEYAQAALERLVARFISSEGIENLIFVGAPHKR
jgi:hypothetical protein